MSLVEQAYRQAISAMSPRERIERMVLLNAWGRQALERSILNEAGSLPPEVLKLRLALMLYGDEPEMRRLIQEAIARVPA